MFGRQSLGSSGSNGNLVEFRAGRMNMVGKMVHPDARKGLVYMTQSDDGLMHFCWKDRTTGKLEDDLIVFPDDFEYKRVDQCKSGRVYVLKFKSSSRRMFYWMQEPKTDKDDEHCRRINELLNNPPSAHQRGGGNDGTDLQYMLNNMSQQQLMQLFGGVGQMGGLSTLLGQMNSRTPPSRNLSSSASGSASSLQTPENVIVPRTPSAPKTKHGSSSRAANLTGSSSQSDVSGAGSGGGGSSSLDAGRSLNIDLSTALSGAEAINNLIADPERVKSLIVHLPESEDADENRKQQIKDHINSPQFQQALAQFSNALQSAQLGPVVNQFQLSPEAVAAAYTGNLEEFVYALERSLPAGTTLSGSEAKETSAAAAAAVGAQSEKKAESETTAAAAKEENAEAKADKQEEKQK